MKVVDLGEVKDLRQSWEEVRRGITAGRVRSFALMVTCHDGREAVYLGGQYLADKEAAARAGLRLSLQAMRKDGTSS